MRLIVPFPSRLKKKKKDDEDERLFSIFTQIHINLPFLEAMMHMPKGAKITSWLENLDLRKLTRAKIRDLFLKEQLMLISDRKKDPWRNPFCSNSVHTRSYEGVFLGTKLPKYFDNVIVVPQGGTMGSRPQLGRFMRLGRYDVSMPALAKDHEGNKIQYIDPEREFQSSRKQFKTSSLDKSRLPDFDLFSDQEEYLKEEVTKTMAKTMEQYMSKTRAYYRSGVARPNIEDKDELKGQFLKELRTNTFSGLDHKDANEHIEKVLKIVDLFHILNITIDQVILRAFPMSLTRAASCWLRNKPSGSITSWEDL
nr:hypothetical protein [Tanacetum cinerariifolium]